MHCNSTGRKRTKMQGKALALRRECKVGFSMIKVTYWAGAVQLRELTISEELLQRSLA